MEQERRRGPTLVPPPGLFLGVFLAGVWLELATTRLRPLDAISFAVRRNVGIALIVAGVAVATWAMIVFWRARTSFLPFRAATNLVSRGPYRFSRNPIYIGDILIYLGASIMIDSGWTLMLLPFAIATLYVLVIRKEEEHLSSTFSGEYHAYRRRVRRWL